MSLVDRSEKKYVLLPGMVTSQTDRQHHHVNAESLRMLYNVPASECVVYDYDRAFQNEMYVKDNEWKLKLIHLAPKYNGKYVVPGPKKVTWPFPVVYGKIPGSKKK